MPPAARRPVTGHIPTPAEQHEEWLRLLRPDGPFVSLPVLTEVFPQGLDTVPKEALQRLRQAWAEVQEDTALLRHGWERLILGEVLGWTPGLREGAALPESLRAGANTPDAVLLGPDRDGPVSRGLFFRTPGWGDSLTRASGDTPSAVDRAADLARWREVPLALLTNGREWALVHARPKEATTLAVFDADLWLEEPLLLRAFASLLHARRVALPARDEQGAHTSSLAALYARTADQQAEVTDTLGKQVRAAVALLVAELSRLDRESGGELLVGVNGKPLYDSALTVMMRLVFLLYAEEQRLLPADDRLYSDSYAVGPLHDELDAERSLHGGELGDRRAAAWPRLLAVFAAIHGGSTHDELWIPAYGGSLFDPARFPWLAGAKVTDRVVYEILDALLVLRRKGKGGREALSYKGLDVEQIGHVYEGLLEYGCERADQPYVGVVLGRDGRYEAVLPLADLERWQAAGTIERELKEATGVTSIAQIRKALEKAGTVTAELHASAGNDDELAARIAPFAGLVGDDLRGEPMVFPAGSMVMVRSGNRRNTGTHYTPKPLAEEVVEHTLAPLCFSPGPAEGAAVGVWRAKPAEELLKLRVLDPAMGSGAFLVSACRYLSDRVVDAWLRDGLPDEIRKDVGEDDRDELLRVARRLVADRCLYGVDRDPMAVELAKLSLWLVTLAKGRPFSFLDHALRCGDSLVGVIDVEQIKAFHLESGARQLSEDVSRALDVTETLLSEAAELRREIEATPVHDIRSVQAKTEKLRRAEALSEQLRLAADAVVGAALAAEGISDEEASELTGEEKVGGKRGAAQLRDAKENAKERAYRNRLESVAGLVATALEEERARDGSWAEPGSSFAGQQAREMVDRWLTGERTAAVRPLHWPLEFPEIMGIGGSSGFDVVMGNPPFVGGLKITGALGHDYREYLVNRLAGGTRGHADLCAYFLLRNLMIAPGQRTGIIATNTIAQGYTREVGLDQATSNGWTVSRAVRSQPWPGTANLEVALVWLSRDVGATEAVFLDGQPVKGITPLLTPLSRATGMPHQLVENENRAFIGSYVLGAGFILEPEQAQALIKKDPKNKDVLFPYFNGDDLNQRTGSAARRWVINFRDRSREAAAEYEDAFAIVEQEVKPERAKNKNKQRREIWWRFTRPTIELYESIDHLDRVIAIGQTSSTQLPALLPRESVFDQKLTVFPTESYAELAFRSSEFQFWWTVQYGPTRTADLVYTPTTCCAPLPVPELTGELSSLGLKLEELQKATGLALTPLSQRIHSREDSAAAVIALRDIHRRIDYAVLTGYGWDFDLEYAFHETRRGTRYTMSPKAQNAILDRLLELNHARYEEEVKQGQHTPEAKRRRAATRKAKAKAPAAARGTTTGNDGETLSDGLFPQLDGLF
ncbi:Eco57I restriction-modification methylase domain-containing protein [Streptomyces sp. NPDC019443]|uniref:Eco57I restriction-modification methylase domain-containing protein n=1 Tax=Streptomyces sp. NPDC019443 TaxID=3365061 RepID=UPI003795A9A1